MSKVINFIKSRTPIITWTVIYTAVMWAILWGLFDFDMFSAHYWHRLMRAQLNGFPGFVFGILILAMVPMYIATTTLVARGKITPIKFNIQIPSFWRRPAEEVPQTKSDDKQTADADTPTESERPLPASMPTELRHAFIRARNQISPTQTSNVDLSRTMNAETLGLGPIDAPAPDTTPVPILMESGPRPATTPHPTTAPTTTPDNTPNDEKTDSGLIPIPDDFDVTDTGGAFPFDNAAPMFSDITFTDAPDITPTPAAQPTENSEISLPEYMTEHGHKIISNSDGIILTPTLAVATHDDEEFWVADDDTWFATGRQKESPIKQLIAARDTHGVMPILYLGGDNIMDIDNHRQTWIDMGISVIDDISDIPPSA